jgi:GGDEF domain-containing protein
MCDIDSFKRLHDKYGHGAGEIALVSFTRILEEAIRLRTAVLRRRVDNEFVVLLPGVEIREAVSIGEVLRGDCEAPALLERDPPKFTSSIRRTGTSRVVGNDRLTWLDAKRSWPDGTLFSASRLMWVRSLDGVIPRPMP